MGLTRRDLIAHLMSAGSYGAALGSLSALGLLPAAATASTFQPLGLPTIHDKDRYWDPVMAAANELQMVVSMHVGSSSTLPAICRRP